MARPQAPDAGLTKPLPEEWMLDDSIDDPGYYFRYILGWQHVASYQEEIARALVTHSEVAARSANGVGKSYLAAGILSWWFDTRPRAGAIIAGPKFAQAHRTFRYLRSIRSQAPWALPGVCRAADLRMDGAAADRWWVEVVTAKDAESFAGKHEENGMLAIMEEASGVPDDIYQAAYGCVTGANDKMLHIGNPTKPVGVFANLWKQRGVKCVTISAYDSPNVREGREVVPGLVSQQGIDRLVQRFGADSDTVRVRVHGLPPIGAGNGVFSFAAIQSAKDRGVALHHEDGSRIDGTPVDPVIVGGLDIARLGDDSCALVEIRDGVFVRVLEWDKQTVTETARRAMRWLDETGPSSVLYLDNGAMGVGVLDIIRDEPEPGGRGKRYVGRCYGVDFGGKQVLGKTRTNTGELAWKAGKLVEGDTPMYHDRRSELWVEAAEWTATEGAWHPGIPDDLREELEADLQAVELDPTALQSFKIERKIKTKDRLGRSPDFGDAYCLAAMALIERRLGQRRSEARKRHRVPEPVDDYRAGDDGRRVRLPRDRAGLGGYAVGGCGLAGM